MNPIFKDERDFVRFWKEVPDVSSISFQNSVDDIYKHSYVCKSFRCEFEVENTFTKKGLKSVKNGDVKLDKKQKLAVDKKVPGFTLKSYIPQQSCFTTSEMVELFKITLLMSQGKELTHEQQKILSEHSQALQNEQASYQHFAMNQWMHFAINKHSQISPEVMKYVNTFWKLKLEKVREYPKYFSQVQSIPLKDNDLNANYRGTFTYITTAGHIGKRTAKYSFPHLRMFLVKAQDVFEKMNNDLDVIAVDDTSTKHGWPQYKTVYKNLLCAQYHPDVSKDKKAETIAYNSDVQIVMSASAFCALINHSGHESSWDIFVSVKEVERETGKKKILFLDKKFPPKVMTIVDRQKFFIKKAIKSLLVKPATEMRAECSKMFDCTELETFGIDSGMNNSINPLQSDNTSLSTAVEEGFETDQSVHSDDLYIETDKEDNECGKDSENDNCDKIMDDGNQKKNWKEKNEKSFHRKNENRITNFIIDYNLWEMKACHEGNVLSKKTRLKDLKLLIRVSHEGRGTFSYAKMGRFKLSAKLEYQPEYGAESVTLEESIKDWSSILIRPNTMLGRVRMDPITGEMIQIEKKNLSDLTTECRRLHSLNPYVRLRVAHTVLDKLTELKPGSYIINHEYESESFVTIFKQADRNHTLNLSLKYCTINVEDVASPHMPWRPLDTMVITPTFHYFRRVPCCFVTSRFKNCAQKRTLKMKEKKNIVTSKKKTKKTKKQANEKNDSINLSDNNMDII